MIVDFLLFTGIEDVRGRHACTRIRARTHTYTYSPAIHFLHSESIAADSLHAHARLLSSPLWPFFSDDLSREPFDSERSSDCRNFNDFDDTRGDVLFFHSFVPLPPFFPSLFFFILKREALLYARVLVRQQLTNANIYSAIRYSGLQR